MSNAEDSEPLLSTPRNGGDDDDVDPPTPPPQYSVNENVDELKQSQFQPLPQTRDPNDVFGVITVNKSPVTTQPQYLPQFRPGDIQRPVSYTNYTWVACLAALCCCPLLGLVGVYYGMLSEKQYNDGQHEEARKSSHMALGFTIAAVVGGIVIVAISVPLQIILFLQPR